LNKVVYYTNIPGSWRSSFVYKKKAEKVKKVH